MSTVTNPLVNLNDVNSINVPLTNSPSGVIELTPPPDNTLLSDFETNINAIMASQGPTASDIANSPSGAPSSSTNWMLYAALAAIAAVVFIGAKK